MIGIPLKSKSKSSLQRLIRHLLRQLSSKDADVRRAAARAIGEIKPKTIPKTLLNLLNDPNPYVRRAATEAIGEIKPKAIPKTLLNLLNDPTPSVRRAAARAILNLLNDPNPYVRRAAARAIGKIKYADNTLFSRSIMVAAKLDTGKDFYGTRGFIKDELISAIRNGIIVPIGEIVLAQIPQQLCKIKFFKADFLYCSTGR